MTRASRPLTDRAAAYIRKHGLIRPGDRVLAAVSGGPDSVALLDILTHLKPELQAERISVVHFDHRLRGEDSDADREFARALARDAGMDFHCGWADVRATARERRISIEMAARECRHSFFRQTAQSMGANRIALGHTASDQAEEVLLRILRGTGPGGIQAMPPAVGGGVIRPLLFATREEILRHIHARGLEFREDLTNTEPFCQRNRLRLEVFPLLRDAFHPEIEKTIARYADLARDEDSWWRAEVERAWSGICEARETGRIALRLSGLRELHTALLRRVLRHALEAIRGDLSGIGMTHIEALAESVGSDKPGRSIRFPGGFEAIQRDGKLVLRKVPEDLRGVAACGPIEIPGPGTYRIGPYRFEITVSESGPHESFPPRQNVAHMDAAGIKWPLLLRFRQPGDRFHPLGMAGSKKLQDFFTDLKIPRERREAIPLLCDREKICWVTGLRLDERVRPGPETRARVIAAASLEE